MVADDDFSTLLREANESDGISVELRDDASSLPTESLKLDEKTIELTAEDVAWVDSCFAFGTELSDDNWINLKDALLEALNSYPIYDEAPSVIQAKGVTEEDHVMEDYPSEELQKEKASYVDVLVSQEDTNSWSNIFTVDDHAAEHHLSGLVSQEDTNSWSDIFKVDDHAAEHHLSGETQKEVSNVEDSVAQGEDKESRESIFKVWDLETSAVEEEDELIQQLNKLLTGNKPPQPEDPSLALDQETVDELVASMNDLSLKRFDK